MLLLLLAPVYFLIAMCLLSDNIYDYHFVSQGKTTIPSVDDGEEMHLADVRIDNDAISSLINLIIYFLVLHRRQFLFLCV